MCEPSTRGSDTAVGTVQGNSRTTPAVINIKRPILTHLMSAKYVVKDFGFQ